MKELNKKIMTCLCKYRFVILLSFVVISMISISCGSSPKKINTSYDNQEEAAIVKINDIEEITEEAVDIPISISLIHTEDEDMKQLVDAEYEVTHETDNDIFIDINSRYYKRYMSETRFMADKIALFENSENVEYLTMNLDVINNTNERLSIKELNINVDESKQDTIPLIYICTTEERSNSIYFVNESWFNWKGFTFSYSLLKNKESFSGYYTKSRHVPYFNSFVIIDLLDDMIAMGYDYDGLIESIRKRYQHNSSNEDLDDMSNDCVEFSIMENDEDFRYFQDRFKPFGLKKENHLDEYVGFATLYGSIKFDDSDFKVNFITEISLSTPGGFGALSYENDKFDVKLRSSGNDYTLRFPYTTVIEPYGAEMIKLSVMADKSSSHKFHVNIKNDNGLNIRSKDIHFHHYYPKN